MVAIANRYQRRGDLGQAFKAGVVGGIVGGASGFLAYAAGSVQGSGLNAILEKMGRHAFVNAWMSGMQGQNMFSGMLTGAASSLGGAGLTSLNIENVGLLTAGNAVIGGTVSVIGGGKFANGAVTGAFTMLFNELAHDIHEKVKHNRLGFVPLDLGANYGAFQMANYKCNISVDGDVNQITVRTQSQNTLIQDGTAVFSGKASISVDGKIIETKPFVKGYANFNLPASTNVSLVVQGGWNVYFDYGGAAVPVYHPIFSPISLNFKDTIKLK